MRQASAGALLYLTFAVRRRDAYGCYTTGVSNTPQINVPFGYEAVEVEPGRIEIRKKDDHMLTKTIAFRMTTEEYNHLQTFREAFPDRTWSACFRWLLQDPDVAARITARIQAAMKPAS